jgi:hypothetical protein
MGAGALGAATIAGEAGRDMGAAPPEGSGSGTGGVRQNLPFQFAGRKIEVR